MIRLLILILAFNLCSYSVAMEWHVHAESPAYWDQHDLMDLHCELHCQHGHWLGLPSLYLFKQPLQRSVFFAQTQIIPPQLPHFDLFKPPIAI